MVEASPDHVAADLMDEPHVTGRRVSVRTIRDRVEGRGLDPETVADRFDLDLAAVYQALAYYHDHPEEMRRIEAERERSREAIRAEADDHRPPGIDPSEE